MLFGWSKFKGWGVLQFFLSNNQAIHANGLARQLHIGVSTAQTYLAAYEREGVLEKEKTANIVLYRLRETAFTLELKKAYFASILLPFVERFTKENPFVTTLALFGSHAKGAFDEKSDIDLIAISQEKKVCIGSLHELEEKTGKEAKAQVFSLHDWKQLVKKKNSFALAILKNNILLFGDQL